MGKRIISQKRGRGTTTYRAPSFRYAGRAGNIPVDKESEGKITDIIHSQGHSAPLIVVAHGKKTQLSIAPHGVKVGDTVQTSKDAEMKVGNTLPLDSIEEGQLIYNIESKPGDGGKFVRAGGTYARVLTKTKDGVIVQLPSKKKKVFKKNCRATIGIIAGGGRLEKPLLKAGNKYHKSKAKNTLYPRTSAVAMNAVDHPYGGSSSSHKGVVTISPRFASPGRKVGKIRAKRTGRRKGR